VSQPTDPYPAQPLPGYAPSPPPYDDGDYIHPHQRAVIWATRAITYLVYAFIIAVEIILILGFLLLLGGANSGSSFVEWCYRNLDRVMKPFRGIFTPIDLGTAGSNDVQSVFDTSVLFAMIIYAIAGIIIYGFASWLTKKLHRLDIEDREYHARIARERQAYLDRTTAERVAATQAAAAQPAPAAPQQPTQPQPAQPQPTPPQPTPPTDVPPPPG
jgi:uncharacterized protein YggT (Ycf19 family)